MWVAWWLLQPALATLPPFVLDPRRFSLLAWLPSLAAELSHDVWRLVMWPGRGYEEARTLATCGGWVLVGGGGAICGFCILLALGIV